MAGYSSTWSELYSRLSKAKATVFSGSGLRARAARGGAWLGVGSAAEQATRFGRSMILARLLLPQAFGLMAIVGSIASVLHTITDIGVKEGLIQHAQGEEDDFASAAWWLAFARSVSLYGVFFCLAPLVAKIYNNPELALLMRVATFGVIFDGIYSSRAYVALKQMNFARWMMINNGGGICGVVVTIVLSFVLRDVWALVIGSVSESAFRCLFSYIFFPYLPALRWDRQAIRELLGFSKGLFGLSFLNLAFARTDIFVLGKMFSASELGIYTMGIYLVQTPAAYVMNTLGQTFLPTFSQVQSEPERINRILIKTTSLMALLGFPMFVFVWFSGRSLLTVILGNRYGAAAIPLILSALVCLVNLMNAQITTVFYSKGLPQLHRNCVLLMSITVIALIYPLARWFGLGGGQLACLCAVIAGFLYQVRLVARVTGLALPQYWRSFLMPLIISFSMAAICTGMKFVPALRRPFLNITLGAFVCLGAYALSLAHVMRTTPNLFARDADHADSLP
jgi:O-antigen/teichoic acid export membrane protein